MKRFTFLIVLAVAGTCISAISNAQNFEPKVVDLADAAKTLAPKVTQAVLSREDADASFRLAVFPFGNRDGQVTIDMYEACSILQGELVFNLIDEAEGRYFVLDKAGLAQEFKSSDVDPARVAAGNPARTAEVLKQIGLDAAVIGAIDAKDPHGEFTEADFERYYETGEVKKTRITASLVFQDGQYRQLVGKVDQTNLGISSWSPDLSGRFQVEILVDGRALPIYRCEADGSPHWGRLYLILPRSLEGKEYKIRLTNHGAPTVGWMNENPNRERNRLFGAAVFVDGVNSIYQDTGYGDVGPVVVHPKNARRWIMTGPNVVMRSDANAPNGYRLFNYNGYGHSRIEIPGFQANNKYADAFMFVTADESIAQTVGITNEVGMISVYIYAEDLPGDSATIAYSRMGGGTSPGRRMENQTFRVNVKLKDEAVEIWRIIYRYEDDPLPFARSALVPL